MLKLISPAKINLFLKVLGKRSDGYHELSSLFQTIDLVDILTFETAHEDSVICTDSSIPTDETNLVLKATQLFRRKTGLKLFLKIYLEKKIPVQAGLGGGSGNAATTLWAMNQLAGKPAQTQQLQNWSSEIGSDIPFFFSQGTAYCRGRGEIVNSIPSFPSRSCWIVKPLTGLSTPEVYKTLNKGPLLEQAENSQTQTDLDLFLKKPYYYNELENSAFEINPQLKALKLELQESGFDTVVMTGSGSSFYCFGDGMPPARSDVIHYPAVFFNRTPSRWYEFTETV